jgi:hypothetical protein
MTGFSQCQPYYTQEAACFAAGGFCATPSLARLSPTRFRSGFIRGLPIQPAVQIVALATMITVSNR